MLNIAMVNKDFHWKKTLWNDLWRFGRAYANKDVTWQGRKVLSSTVNFWVIPWQRKVYRAT